MPFRTGLFRGNRFAQACSAGRLSDFMLLNPFRRPLHKPLRQPPVRSYASPSTPQEFCSRSGPLPSQRESPSDTSRQSMLRRSSTHCRFRPQASGRSPQTGSRECRRQRSARSPQSNADMQSDSLSNRCPCRTSRDSGTAVRKRGNVLLLPPLRESAAQFLPRLYRGRWSRRSEPHACRERSPQSGSA